MLITRGLKAVDERLGAARFTREALNKVFPDHWSFMVGEVAAYAFLVLVGTGVYLSLFFEPSQHELVYAGTYAPLRGEVMSAAYRSTIRLSHDVHGGLLMRQIHHWAALVFVGAIVAHAARIFFTGAFRKPRELNWFVGLTLLILALANGFTGYSLPDDLLSGTGLRIAWSILLSVPVAGSWLGFTIFGGEFPGEDIIARLFVIHVLIVPVLIAGLLGAHLAMVWRQSHTQFRGAGHGEDTVTGSRMWPTYALRSAALAAAVAGVLALLGGVVQINPVWLYGPYDPAAATTAAQPDWYVGWLEGALRLAPAMQVELLGWRVPEAVVPGVVLPTVLLVILYAWPLLERRVTGDRAVHHQVDRPRDRPVRTALGTAGLSFGAVLLVAGGQDLFAVWLDVPVTTVTAALQIATILVPVVAGVLAWRLCHELATAAPLAAFATSGEAPVGPNVPRAGTAGGPADAPSPGATAGDRDDTGRTRCGTTGSTGGASSSPAGGPSRWYRRLSALGRTGGAALVAVYRMGRRLARRLRR